MSNSTMYDFDIFGGYAVCVGKIEKKEGIAVKGKEAKKIAISSKC